MLDTDQKHPSSFRGRSAQEVAKELGDLRYDALADILEGLCLKLSEDSAKDFNRGRKKLAAALYQSAHHLDLATREISTAWKICEPFMKSDM